MDSQPSPSRRSASAWSLRSLTDYPATPRPLARDPAARIVRRPASTWHWRASYALRGRGSAPPSCGQRSSAAISSTPRSGRISLLPRTSTADSDAGNRTASPPWALCRAASARARRGRSLSSASRALSLAARAATRCRTGACGPVDGALRLLPARPSLWSQPWAWLNLLSDNYKPPSTETASGLYRATSRPQPT